MSSSIEPVPALEVARAAPPRRRVRVLLALTAGPTAPRALQEADDFAQRLGAELHLLRVVPHLAPDVQGQPRDLAGAVRDAQRVLAATRHTRKLSDRVLRELPAARICVRLGPMVDQVAQRASELDALLIIVPPSTMHLAPVVTELARRTDCPVLVPKGHARFGTLLAATDLKDSRTPVLEMAAELARDLGAEVVAFHGLIHAPAEAVPMGALEQCQLKLEKATRSLEGCLESVVRSASTPVQGILEQAHAHDAALIVVGARARPGGALPSTAAQLVSRARRSVLVAPIEAPHW